MSYSTPLTIGTTTVVRARAVVPNREPSPVSTHTYIFPADVIAQPLMSTRITQDPVYGPLMEGSLLSEPSLSIVAPDGIEAAGERGALDRVPRA